MGNEFGKPRRVGLKEIVGVLEFIGKSQREGVVPDELKSIDEQRSFLFAGVVVIEIKFF